jgi:A/G-specific adenine glycosylase
MNSTLNAQRSTLNVQRCSALRVGRWGWMLDVCLGIVITHYNLHPFRSSLLHWFRDHGRDLPWRRTRDPYAVLVAELMLQQTQVATVIPYYRAWLRRFPDFVTLAHASEEEALHAWQGLGYYARARNLRRAAQSVVNQHRGRFPRSIAQMQQLPGIGKYTAHAIATFAFNQASPVVEVNTARVLARVFDFRKPIDSDASRETLWQYAASLVPKRDARIYNSALMDLGALVCVPREPKCCICPVQKFCRATNPELLPIRKRPRRTVRLVERHAFTVAHGWVLLERSSHRWRGMWILPPLKPDLLKQSRLPKRPIYRSVFPFTHHRVTLFVYRKPAPKRIAPEQRWFDSIDHVAMPSPHRRAAQSLFHQRHGHNILQHSLSVEP